MTDDRADADTIRALEQRRYRAMRDGDAAALDRLLADEMVHVHSNAASDSRSSLLGRIRDAELRCSDACHHPDDRIIVHGDTAIATGRVTGTVYVNGDPTELCNRSLAVWSRRRGEWRLLAYQSTPVPAPGAAAATGTTTTAGQATA